MLKSPKRPVARRACLACREKKIKCDGEAIDTSKTFDKSFDNFQDSKTHHTVKSCLNCNLIGIECIFVRSNRGGRRKKNSDTSSDVKRAKSINLEITPTRYLSYHNPFQLPYNVNYNVNYNQNIHHFTNPGVNGNGIHNITDNSNIHMSHIQGQTQPVIYSQIGLEDHLPSNSIFRHIPGYKPLPGPASLPGTLPQWKSILSSIAPSNDDYPRAESLISDTTSEKSVKSRFSYDNHRSLPKLPPLEYLKHQPPLPNIRFPSSSDTRFLQNKTVSEKANDIPIDFKRSINGDTNSEYGHFTDRKVEVNFNPANISSSLSTDIKHESPATLPGIVPTPLQNHNPVSEDFYFSDSELSKYGLPKWETLDVLLNIYYCYQHPNHQLLPSKHLFLLRLTLSLHSSILHAIILNICLITKELPRDSVIAQNEEFWLDNVYKNMDGLNDIGLLICYVLMAKASIVRFNLKFLNEINIKIWEIIKNNNYLYVYSQERFNQVNVTSSQAYERELIIRVLWSFYLNNMVLLRLNQGYPYSELSSIFDEKQFEYEVANRFSKIVLPSENSDYYSFENIRSRTDWSDVEPGQMYDSIAIIITGRVLDNVLNGIAGNNLVDNELTSFEEPFVHYLENEFYELKHDDKVIIVKASVFLSLFIHKTSNLLKHSHFLMDIMNFKLSKNECIGTRETLMILPLISDVSIGNLADFGELPKIIELLSFDQWNHLIKLIESTFEVLNLLNSNVCIPNDDGRLDDYSVVFGPSHIDQGPFDEWWKNPKLHTTFKEAWPRFTEFSLVSACAALSVLASLTVLIKYIKIINNNGKLRVEMLSLGKLKEFDILLSEEVASGFNLANLEKYKNLVTSFIKVRVRCYHPQVGVNTMLKLNKVSHYLEEILNNVQ